MARKLIGGLLTLAAAITLLAWVVGTMAPGWHTVSAQASHFIALAVDGGCLKFYCSYTVDTPNTTPAFDRRVNWLGFHIEWFGPGRPFAGGPPQCYFTLHSPLWMLFVVFAMYPGGFCFRRWQQRRRRRERNLCVKCEYNLMGNTSGTCPECGYPIPYPGERIGGPKSQGCDRTGVGGD